MTYTFEGECVDICSEDNGTVRLAEVQDKNETGLYIRVLSWNPSKEHEDFDNLMAFGAHYRVTIERI